MNIYEYDTLKSKGVVTILKTDGNYVAISSKRYDPNTGEALPDEIEEINVSLLRSRLASLEAEVASLKAFIMDIDAVKP